jgi:peptidoglycan/xylan/chitin deacetylase (PgdA/CDA1 family)
MLVHVFIIFIILICSCFNLNAQKIFVDNSGFFYQISPIYDFKKSILSLTFDDGSLNQFLVALPILKEKGIPSTFYVITDFIDSTIKSILLENLSNNYEIGSHTVSHQNLVKIGNEDAKRQLLNSRSFLQSNFGSNAGLTLSYPWGEYNNSIKLIAKGSYLAARTTDVGYNSLSTLDKYALKMQNFEKRTGAYKANTWIDYAIHNNVWLIEMIHGINNIGYSAIDSKVLTEHLDHIKEVEDKIWCSTVSNVIKYIDESKNTKIICEICNDTVYNIRINDFMDDSVYNQPLSIRIKVPANWDSIMMTNVTKFKTEYNNKSKFILFNALPDNKEITIRPVSISAPQKETGIRLISLSANPFRDNIRLSLEALDQQDIDIVLSDINGRLLVHRKEKSVNGVINLLFDTQGMSDGIYFLRVSNNASDVLIKKMIKL